MCKPAPALLPIPIPNSSNRNASTRPRRCSAPPRRRSASPAPGTVANSRGVALSEVSPAEIVSFWRDAGYERWFEPDETFDETIRSRFLAPHEAAVRGDLSAWQDSPEGALA